MIIDAHTHIHNYEFLGEGIRFTPDQFIHELDHHHIDKAVVSSPFHLETDFAVGNRIVFDLMKSHPNRIIGQATLHPLFLDESLAVAKEAVDRGTRGFKIHCELSHVPYTAAAHLELVASLAEFGLPITLHTGKKYLSEAPALAKKFPGLTFQFAHIGGFSYREMIDRVVALDNVVADLSGNVFTNGFVEDVVAGMGVDRVVFGTDFVFMDPAIMLAMVRNADLTESDKEKILWKNAERILKL